MSELTDTPPEVERELIRIHRDMPPARKWAQMGRLYADGRYLHAAGVRRRNPAATPRDILRDWIVVNLGIDPPPPLGEPKEILPKQSLLDLRDVVRAFDQLGVAYALGGSMASSHYGLSRHTNDADLTAEPFPGREEEFAAALGPDYYLSLDAVRDANRRRSTFNVLNSTTGFKADIFVRKDDPFEHEVLRRRVPLELSDEPGPTVYMQTAEDVVLFKLRWYRLGNEVSEQQWKDVRNVLRTQAGRLDEVYLDRWAAHLGVADLLERARQESRLP
jgi:hypothetical protein